MVGEDEMQGNGNPARVVGAGGMGVRRVALSSESDGSGIEEADSQVGPQRSAASPAASSEPDVEMDPGAQFLQAIACPQSDFTYELDGAFLPKDGPRRECFDHRLFCVLGDPGASYSGSNTLAYETTDQKGGPIWELLFGYLLATGGHLRWCDTVYLLVDNRDLTAPVTQEKSLAHWPAVAAWWRRRLALQGPGGEKCDLFFVPIAERSGLHLVHPTWAGTFVLSAVTFLFPQINFVLLDSDCLPITLFEIQDLWKEARLGLGMESHASSDEHAAKASRAGNPTRDPLQVDQGVLLVTEHNAEINAGFIVVFASKHSSPVSRTLWKALWDAKIAQDPQRAQLTHAEGTKLAKQYWGFVETLLATVVPPAEMSEEECGLWIQSGLVLTPFAGCRTRFSVDWTICWALIGQWTSRELFPPPKGKWPRNGHPEKLLDHFAERRPPILTWAHSSFEQGSLPSMLHLPGEAVLMILPGDRMFQAQYLVQQRCRPAILHGYGGGKHAMPSSLTTLAGQGWVPLATAMVGKPGRPPAWYGEDLRLVVGTSVDCRVLPTPLSEQEEQLLLTLWRRIPLNELPEGCAIRTWLDDKRDLPPAADPGGSESPHCVCKDKSTVLLDSLDCWTLIKNARGDPLSNNVLMALRILAYTMTVDQLRMLAGFLLGDDTATWFPHSRWLGIVRELMAGHPLLRVGSHGDLTNLFMLVPEGSTHLMASTAQGHLVAAWEVRSLQLDSHSEFFPMEIVAPSTGQVRNQLPEKVEVECTGLGGHDLGGPIPWHLCIRTDKFKQGIYGPSIACLEGSLSGGQQQAKCEVALGLTKAMHEFLILHYFATDSADSWDLFLSCHLPRNTWRCADTRRKEAISMFQQCHVAPSYRRPPHKMWVDTMSLYIDLLLGRGKRRYVDVGVHPPDQIHVAIRGFSAGSYSGLCLLHLLWKCDNVEASGKLGGIAVPPQLLRSIPESKRKFVHLVHFKPDQLCCWSASRELLDSIGCEYTFVENSIGLLKEHFGKEEHAYGHWVNLHLAAGYHQLWQLLERFPDAAHPRKRDAAPLRLISWLSCKLPPHVDGLIQEVMLEFAQLEPVHSDRILRIGEFHLGKARGALSTWDDMRDALISEITLSGLPNPAAVVLRLMTMFLQRLPLPRLVHFIDLVLPQMVPSDSPSQRDSDDAMCSLLLRNHQQALSEGQQRQPLQVEFGKLFSSHSGILHVSMNVNSVPFLLFASASDFSLSPVADFKSTKSVNTAKQNVVLGLKKGYTILLHFQVGSIQYHAVLYLIKSTPGKKGGQDQHKLWKHVVPTHLEFAWLPHDLALTFCANALDKDPRRLYAMPDSAIDSNVQAAWVTVDQIYWIGECKSAHELDVFVNMPIERLRVGCGLQCTLPLHPLGPSSRPKLFAAAVNLLKFAMTCHFVDGANLAEDALAAAIEPVLWQNDEHVLATISSLVLALLEGRTDLPISGVFGAGKTRAAAIMVAGLLTFDPTLRILILTKENTAAKAFADHLISLRMPEHFFTKIGRLVGYMELRKNTGNKTMLDLPAERRTDALWGKQILIGCGGGYQQECNQAFSLIPGWLDSTDLSLTDESQQYGNLEETATVARTPRTCLHVWMGDHRQTPGGLKKTEEAYRFRQKLQTRPLALRCGTTYVQPHELKGIIGAHLDGPVGSPSHCFRELLLGSTPQDDHSSWDCVMTLWQQICGHGDPWLSTSVCLGAFAVLWMATLGEGVTDMTARTLRAAAGLEGKHHWGLILSSSARVTQLTYETVIGVRYPELVKRDQGHWSFGRFLPGEALIMGGFIPILWDVPKSNLCAVEDVGALVEWAREQPLFCPDSGQEMAVLHNQNKMVTQFGTSAWVAQSKHKVYSRSVTSCAGMTAFLVVVAQTRIGFLSGGRGAGFLRLRPEDQISQTEDAYARATVALTRAQAQTILFGPLDMKGLPGAATVIGSLVYGVGHCWRSNIQMHWRHGDLQHSDADAAALDKLRQASNEPNGKFPPLALLECVFDKQETTNKLRRLHLIIVDLWRPWRINREQVRAVTSCLRHRQPEPMGFVNTPMVHSGGTPHLHEPKLHERRFIYGYGLDGSDFPCYLMWPERVGSEQSVALLDSQANWWCKLTEVGYMCPLDLHHLMDAFRITAELSSAHLREIAVQQLGLLEGEVTADCQVSMDAARRKGWLVHEEQPVDLVAPEADVRNVPEDVISVRASEVDDASTVTSSNQDDAGSSSDSSDDSSTTDEPAPSVASEDHNMLVQAYGMTQNHFTVTRHALVGGRATLNIMDIYPMQWPLAKIKIPIDYLIQRVERLLTGFANEISATQWYPATFDRRIKSSAKFLTERIAIYLAKEVASILRPVVSHPLLTQFDPDSKPLLTSDFWVMPIYKELLYSGSRPLQDRSSELKRPATGLVKIVCQAEAGDEPEEPVDNSKGPRVGTKQYLNAVSPIQYMNVWIPAHWAPVVMEVLETKNEDFRKKYPRWFPESGSARASGSYGQSRENRALSFCKGRMDRDESLPTLTGRLKADWIHLPVDDVLALFPTVREGICMGVFRQKAAATWFRPRPTKLQVTVLIPGPLSVDDWLDKLGTLSHAWPQPHQLRSLQVTRVSAQAFEAARVSAAVKHLWPGLRPQWTTIYSTLRLEWPGVYDPSVLHGKFFDNVGQSDHTQDSQYQGNHLWWVLQRFRANQYFMAQRLTISEPWGFGSWQANMVEFEDTLRLERAELDSCEEARKANHQYRTSHGTYRIKRTQ